MEPKNPAPEKDSAQDAQAFERLPVKTKELSLLKDQAEKATGPENAELTRKILDKAAPGS